MEHIHEYLRSVGENIRAGRMKLEDFIIFKVCKRSWARPNYTPNYLVDIRASS